MLLGYLAVLAAWPWLRDGLPRHMQWFGRPNSAVTLAVVVVVLIMLGVAITRADRNRRPTAPLAIVAGLALVSAALGVASYWRCQDDSHPDFFTMLVWTANLVKGGNPEQSLDAGACPPYPAPLALTVAQLCALAAVFLSVVGVAAALFRSRVDRVRILFAHSVTAVVDPDDTGGPILAAIAGNLDPRSRLVVVTADPDRPVAGEARNQGARILAVDFTRPTAVADLPIWHKLDKLYLLSPDPSANLGYLRSITAALGAAESRVRIPLIVRIDDPWQAVAWRAQYYGGADSRWAADTVGLYEITARCLVDRVLAGTPVARILVCGASQLTLAICADLAQRYTERAYHSYTDAPLPTLTLMSDDAEEYRSDHRYARIQRGLPADLPPIDTVAAWPSVREMSAFLADNPNTAVILVNDASGVDPTTGTRLAARYPNTPIYAWDPRAESTAQRYSLVGRLQTYRLSMDLPEGQAHDAWERAARLIHDRWATEHTTSAPASRPWSELSEFYRGSNRRQVHNALWMVEKIGSHTWDTWGNPPESLDSAALATLAPLDQLQRMGFDRDTALEMARREHEDWCRYYRSAGWTFAPVRDDTRKHHDKLIDWAVVAKDPGRRDTALSSLATTLSALRELGYRSRPVDEPGWQRFQRTGTVFAEQREQPWCWTTSSGDTLQAEAGDWAVRETEGGEPWSVRDDIFRATHEHLADDRWSRRGSVQARLARPDEAVGTLEGRVTSRSGDWVVRGTGGECWVVPGDEFIRRYEPFGPISPTAPDQP